MHKHKDLSFLAQKNCIALLMYTVANFKPLHVYLARPGICVGLGDVANLDGTMLCDDACVCFQGLIESAQMAQAASALQQSGLAPYLLQQQYTAQLAQLQQVRTSSSCHRVLSCCPAPLLSISVWVVGHLSVGFAPESCQVVESPAAHPP